MSELIKALQCYDSLEAVIAELRGFDRDETIEDLVEYLNDEAEYSNY